MKPSTRQDLLPGAILAALAVVASAVILHTGRDTIFFYDEWDFVLGRRGLSVDTLLDPHVGHLSLVPILIYKALYSTVGLAPYWPYRLTVVLGHLVCVGLLYTIARRRLGAWPALAVATLLLFLGSAWEVLLWPFEISYLASLAAGLGAWLLLQEEGRGRDVAASVLAGVSLASSGVGVPVAAGLLAGLLLVEGRRSRAWLLAPPLALYAIWLLGWGLPADSPESIEAANLPDVPRYLAGMAASAAGGLIGLDEGWGRIAIVVLAAVLVVAVLRRGLPPWLGAGIAAALVFWVLTGLARADVSPSTTSRYIYPSAVFLLLIAVELAAARPRPALAGKRAVWALAAIAVAFAAVGNMQPLRDGGRHLRSATAEVEPALAALEIGDGAVDPGARIEPQFAPQVAAGPYLVAVEDLGSPLPDGPGGEPGAAVDAALIGAERIALAPSPAAATGASPPALVTELGGTATPDGGCIRFTPESVPAALDLRAAPGTAIELRNRGEAPAEVRVRRFAADFPATALGSLAPGTEDALSFPRDARPAPWIVRVSPGGPVAACSVG